MVDSAALSTGWTRGSGEGIRPSRGVDGDTCSTDVEGDDTGSCLGKKGCCDEDDMRIVCGSRVESERTMVDSALSRGWTHGGDEGGDEEGEEGSEGGEVIRPSRGADGDTCSTDTEGDDAGSCLGKKGCCDEDDKSIVCRSRVKSERTTVDSAPSSG